MLDLSLSSDPAHVKSDGGDRILLESLANMVSPPSDETMPDDLPIQTLRFIWQAAARRILPHERVAQCLRTIAPGKSRVEIVHSKQQRRANYCNLIVCGRLWQCPVCAARISEHRRKTLSSQLARLPYLPILITYTVRTA